MTLSRPLLAALFAALAAVPAILPAAAAPNDPVTDEHGEVLRIPGLPPIQLRPGARVFGPQGPAVQGPGVVDEERPRDRLGPPDRAEEPETAPKSRREAQKPPRKPPASIEPVGVRRARVLDELFKSLAATNEVEEAKGVATAIERVWLRSGSDTADLLMSRAVHAMGAKELKLAEQILDSVVDIAPAWAEGWNKRATVRFLRDDLDGAMRDIDQTLKREPRHFGALGGLGAILQKTGLDKRALEAFRKALAVYPEQPELRKVVDKLQLEVEGRDI